MSFKPGVNVGSSVPYLTHCLYCVLLLLALGRPIAEADSSSGQALANGAAPNDANAAPTSSKKAPCTEQSSQTLHHLEDNGGAVALSLETTTYGCWPVLWDARTVVRGGGGEVLVFVARTVQSAPGRMSMKSSRYQVTFPDDSVLELKVGSPIINAPGLTEEYPGSSFKYKDRELFFTIEKPLKPVWDSKEGRAFRELLPESAAAVMEVLAEARNVLLEEAVFAGFLEFFPALYQGKELGYGTRDGYSLVKITGKAQRSDRAVRTDVFKREAKDAKEPDADGEKKSEDVPKAPAPSTPSETPIPSPIPPQPGLAPTDLDVEQGSRALAHP